MTLQIVTGFVPIHGHPRGAEEYHKLGMALFSELAASNALDYPVCAFNATLDRCWLHGWLTSKGKAFKVTHSTADNPDKNTLAYHIVQHEKINMLKEAAEGNPTADVFAWIDFGILHVPGVTTRIVSDFFGKASKEKVITIPGCWDRGPIDDAAPCWRFCGGLIVVPREYIYDLDILFKAETIKRINETRNLTWEVNTLARLEQSSNLPIWQYKADHNETMFTSYPEVSAHA